MFGYEDDALPAPGRTAWHGDRLYGTCDNCGKLVQLNKRGVGSMHICISPYERALRNGEIVSLLKIKTLLLDWSEVESLAREVGGKHKVRGHEKISLTRLAKKLSKKGLIESDELEAFVKLSEFISKVNKSYKKDYELGGWVTTTDYDVIKETVDNFNWLFNHTLETQVKL